MKIVVPINLADAERALVIAAFEQANTREEAAVLLGISRNTLARRMDRHGFKRGPPRGNKNGRMMGSG